MGTGISTTCCTSTSVSISTCSNGDTASTSSTSAGASSCTGASSCIGASTGTSAGISTFPGRLPIYPRCVSTWSPWSTCTAFTDILSATTHSILYRMFCSTITCLWSRTPCALLRSVPRLANAMS